MTTFKQYITEVKTSMVTSVLNGKSFRVYINPTADQLVKIAINNEKKHSGGGKKIPYPEIDTMRGHITPDGDAVFWDADDAIHADAAEGYGVSGQNYNRLASLYVWIDQKHNVRIEQAYPAGPIPRKEKAIIEKLYKKLYRK